MRIVLATPAPGGGASGNATTALRWARILRSLGHRVRVVARWENQPCDLLLALHARKSAGSVRAYSHAHPSRPIVVGLAGTDLYRDIKKDRTAQRSLDLATRLVLLQPRGFDELPKRVHAKTLVIFQSAERPAKRLEPLRSCFEVLVAANLRPVKDPLRAALAVRRLPAESPVRVALAGAPLSASLAERAAREAERNPRFRWLGTLAPARVHRLMTRARVVCLTSRSEGGANVLSEAIMAGTPIVSSAIPGSIGILGDDHPAYFPVGDTAALRDLLRRAEADNAFLRDLARCSRALRPLVSRAAERRAWRSLLAEL